MRIVFFDIDGTLAEGRYVPESAAEAIRAFRANGDAVLICTGRYPPYVKHYFADYADGFVCCNGRYAMMGERILVDQPLTGQQVRGLCDALDRTGISYMFYEADGAHFHGEDAIFDEVRRTAVDAARLDRQIDPATIRAYNFDVLYSEDRQYREAVNLLEDSCLFNPHGAHPSADVTIRGADKGDAIRRILAALGAEAADSYAFGDGMNDISMLQAVGHGIAMGNAVPELKAVAEYVTTDLRHDGVRNGMQHYFLI